MPGRRKARLTSRRTTDAESPAEFVAIALRIALSVQTCRAHVAKIYEGLGAHSRCQLGVLIAQSGLLDEG